MRLWLLVLSLMVHGAAAVERYTEADFRQLLIRSEQMQLADQYYWSVLLHLDSGGVSRVDDDRFFLAENGKRDAKAELQATLAAQLGQSDCDDVMERFPARAEWLIEQLQLDRARLPVACAVEFEEVWQRLQPDQVTLVYPAAYINSPASMFGHTFLLIRNSEQSELLAQALNFAAITGEDNGVIFAFRGIFGMYPGQFSFTSYYEKVREYAGIDQRDMWEYQLGFEIREIRRLMLHIWEMRGIRSDYYFFDENCSFALLYLLEVARPELRLVEQSGLWVIPLDTIKMVEAAGLIADRVYRPALATRIRYAAAELDSAIGDAIHGLAKGRVGPGELDLAHSDQQQALELAAEYLQTLRAKNRVRQEDYQQRLMRILRARARLAESETEPLILPEPTPPERGHHASRVRFGAGISNDESFVSLAYRPAYHELLDPSTGFEPGAQIVFFGGEVRYWPDREEVDIQQLDLIRLVSLPARDRFYAPLSWTAGVGLRSEWMSEERRVLHGFGDVGIGGCWRLGSLRVYGMGCGDARLIEGGERYAGGGGVRAGVLWLPHERYGLQLTGDWLRYGLGADASNWHVELEQRFSFTRNLALDLGLGHAETWSVEHSEVELGLRWFF